MVYLVRDKEGEERQVHSHVNGWEPVGRARLSAVALLGGRARHRRKDVLDGICTVEFAWNSSSGKVREYVF